MNDPRFFVQTHEDRVLHAYWDEAILRIHLRQNGTDAITVFVSEPRSPGTRIYRPMDTTELRSFMNPTKTA